jgi:hypothetical protein
LGEKALKQYRQFALMTRVEVERDASDFLLAEARGEVFEMTHVQPLTRQTGP